MYIYIYICIYALHICEQKLFSLYIACLYDHNHIYILSRLALRSLALGSGARRSLRRHMMASERHIRLSWSQAEAVFSELPPQAFSTETFIPYKGQNFKHAPKWDQAWVRKIFIVIDNEKKISNKNNNDGKHNLIATILIKMMIIVMT